LQASYVIHYSEIALKGKNRPEFVRALKRAIRRAVDDDAEASIEQIEGRFLLTTKIDSAVVGANLSKVFGVAWYDQVSIVEPVYDDIRESVLSIATTSTENTFRIEARRNDKAFPIGSMELERRLGEEVVGRTGMGVDLTNPGRSIHVDILHGKAFVYANRRKGPGGLPVGTAGRVIHLFSGGIDSPVAAWLLMKRGCTPVYLHFYLAPNSDWVLKSKIIRLLQVLSAYSGKSTMILIPFDEYQIAASGKASDLEPSLFRRFMRLTAESLAPRFGASALATGDSLSQAASQTLWNLAVFDSGCQLPILRPLVAYDKDEVIRLARTIGTYEASIEEYKDCCSIVTKHPRTRVNGPAVSQQSERLNFRELIDVSIERGTLVTFSPSSGTTKATPLSELGSKNREPVIPRQNYKQVQTTENKGAIT
jgi:tRNA uracil 4-sulfurtransferase